MKIWLGLGLLLGSITACTPRYDWRDVRGPDATPFTISLPGKPSTESRTIELAGLRASMSMTAVQVDSNLFAVGALPLASQAQVEQAQTALRAALLNNIHGHGVRERRVTANQVAALEIEADGTRPLRGQTVPVHLVVRLAVRGHTVYQVMALGDARTLPADAIDTLMTSFKLN